jgi:hypothetical protein
MHEQSIVESLLALALEHGYKAKVSKLVSILGADDLQIYQ